MRHALDRGQNTSASIQSIPPDFPRRVRGMVAERGGDLQSLLPHETLYSLGVGLGVRSLTKFIVPGVSRFVWCNGANDVVRQDEGAALSTTTIGTVSAGTTARFAQVSKYLYWVDGASSMKVWYGSGSSTSAGVVAPDSAPTRTDNGAGLLNSVGKPLPTYEWAYTFVNAQGVESAPSLASAPLQVADRKVLVRAIRSSAYDAEYVSVRWYRRGGVVKDFYRVGETAVIADSFAYPNTGAEIDDNMRDIDVSTIKIPRGIALPPAGADIIMPHRNRLWIASTVGAGGTGSSLSLWYSALDKPEIFGSALEDTTSGGGYITLIGSEDNGVLSLSSTGSLLVIGRRRSVDVLFGNSSAEFKPSQRSNVGVAATDCMCRGYNDVYFVGSDRHVYRLTDSGVEVISEAIFTSLDALSDAVINGAKLVFANGFLYLTFKTGSAYPDDIAYIYDPKTGAWYEDSDFICADIASIRNLANSRDDLVLASGDGRTIKRCYTGSGSKYVSWQSAEQWPLTPGDVEVTCVPGAFSVVGAVTLTGTPANDIKFTIYPQEGATRDIALNVNNGYLFRKRPKPLTCGMHLKYGIRGYVNALRIQSIVTNTGVKRSGTV